MFKALPEIRPKQDDVPHGETPIPQLSATYTQTVHGSFETAKGPQMVNINDSAGDDMVIVVMGPPGCGKSTFIRAASGLDATEVDDALESSPSHATVMKFWDHASERRVVLVDTPSFDDTFEFSFDMSNMTLSSNKKKIHLSAILYLHRITDNRVAGTSLNNFKVFERLCGNNYLDKVYFTTTMWDEIEPSVGKRRLAVLRTEYWKSMIDQGAQTARCRSDDDSSQRLIQQIILSENPPPSRLEDPSIVCQSEEAAQTAQSSSQFAKEAKVVSINDLEADDIVIAIMGLAGSGKKTFIRSASGLDISKLSEGGRVTPVRYWDRIRMRHVVLVYMPGFDNMTFSDLNVLRMISEWLVSSYNKRILLSGIFYLHRITDHRVAGSTLKNLRAFRKLCGWDALDTVYLVTTMWNEVDTAVGEKRLEELKTEYWKTMTACGAQIVRCGDNADSPKQLIRRIIALGATRKVLMIQDEMAEMKKELKETAAGKEIYSQLETVVEKQLELLRRIDKERKAASDPEIVLELQTESNDLRAQIDEKLRQMQRLKSPSMLKRFFSRKRD